MPRDMIMFRKFYEDSGETNAWKALYSELSKEDKEELMDLVSLPVAELRSVIIPKKFAKIIPYYFLKKGTQQSSKKNKVLENQISFDDAFALMEEELKDE